MWGGEWLLLHSTEWRWLVTLSGEFSWLWPATGERPARRTEWDISNTLQPPSTSPSASITWNSVFFFWYLWVDLRSVPRGVEVLLVRLSRRALLVSNREKYSWKPIWLSLLLSPFQYLLPVGLWLRATSIRNLNIWYFSAQSQCWKANSKNSVFSLPSQNLIITEEFTCRQYTGTSTDL